jgi:hypothetical protein
VEQEPRATSRSEKALSLTSVPVWSGITSTVHQQAKDVIEGFVWHGARLDEPALAFWIEESVG